MKMSHIFLTLLSVSIFGTAQAKATDCQAEKSLTEAALQNRLIIVDDHHGSAEIPDYLLQVACHLLNNGKPLLIGLEIPASEQEAINNYLQSDGDAYDRMDLLSGIFWHRARKYGMASEAVFSVIETSRKWNKAGLPVMVFAFDQAENSWPVRLQKQESFWGGYRETIMALNINVRARLYPQHTVLILVGGIHARKYAEPREKYPSMAHTLAQIYPIYTITFSHPEGEAWYCGGQTRETMQCGTQKIPKSKLQTNPAFDVTIALEKISASPPAVDK